MSTVDESGRGLWAKMQADAESRHGRNLKDGGGGGTFDGMEDRVKRLEADVSEIKKLLADVRVILASIDERTKHMPTHWQAFGIFLGSLAGMGAIVAITARFLG